MNKAKVSKSLAIAVILLFLSVSVIPSTGTAIVKKSPMPTPLGNILYVGGNGTGNYSSIQEAINNASNRDTVFVYDDSSPYVENVIVNKSINLVGENRNTTILDGSSIEDVVNVSADWVNISEFTIQNSGDEWDDAGIEISSKYATITGNIIILNNRKGIYLNSRSSNNIITVNTISNNSDGIDFTFSDNNTITGNNISNNDGKGIRSDYSINNTITGNTVTLNHHSSIYLWDSHSNKIMDNTISNNDYGIYVTYSIRNIIIGNNITNNGGSGISLRDSAINTISGNTISNNMHRGINLITSNITTISGNTISNNMQGGIWLYASSNNTIYHNNLINNTQNVNDTDNKNNTWDNGYPSCGNYWDDYSGVDNYSGSNQDISGPDGIGDTPYSIPGGENKDRYPLMEPYGMTKLTMNIGWGLFKFSVGIKNIGNKTAFNVQWKITIDGGFIIVGRHSSGTLPKPLLAGEETTVSSGIFFGFGRIMITIAVWADNAPLISESIPGTLFLIFLML